MSESVSSNNHSWEAEQESGWCSGYHARFTRERSRVRTSHPIFFHFFYLTVIIVGRIIFEITITIITTITTTTTTIRFVTIDSDDVLYTHHSPTRNHFKSILPHSWITPLS